MSTETTPETDGQGTVTKPAPKATKPAGAPKKVATPAVKTESAPAAEPQAAETTEDSIALGVPLALHIAAKVYAAFLAANPNYVGVVNPAWAPASKVVAERFLAYAKDNGQESLLDSALEVFCASLKTNPNYISYLPEGVYLASFSHAASIHKAFNL